MDTPIIRPDGRTPDMMVGDAGREPDAFIAGYGLWPFLALPALTTANEELASYFHACAVQRASAALGWNTRRALTRTASLSERLCEPLRARARNMTLRKPPPDQPNTLSGGPPIALGQRARWRRMRSGSLDKMALGGHGNQLRTFGRDGRRT